MERLLEGYRSFRRERWPHQQNLYRKLANGQKPETLVIACCDSRVDPASIFNASPGELFVIRNVANLVPPAEQGPGLHGTAAAIEFAVTELKVRQVMVMGHARCGGVAAAIDHTLTAEKKYIGEWVALLEDAVHRCANHEGDMHDAVEHEAVRLSLERLYEYSFIKERLDANTLKLEGTLFDVATGELKRLNHTSGRFELVDLT